MSTTTRDFVMSKPELIEAILLQLPMRDLLVHAQLVNKDFHSVITHSPSLQRKLFFVTKPASSPRKSASFDGSAGDHGWERNPLLCELFPPWFRDYVGTRSQLRNSDINGLRKLDWNSSKRKTVAYARREASWRKMLVTQPLMTKLEIVQTEDADGGLRLCKGEIIVASGLRMGLLFDLVEHHMIACSPVATFDLQWVLDAPSTGSEIEGLIILHQRYVFQCSVGTMGKGFWVTDAAGRHPKDAHGRDLPMVIETWQFHSEGYEHVEIKLKEIP